MLLHLLIFSQKEAIPMSEFLLALIVLGLWLWITIELLDEEI